MIIKDEITGGYAGIVCDAKDCTTKAPPSEEILRGHGLNNMGWRCVGGNHLCPEHAKQGETR